MPFIIIAEMLVWVEKCEESSVRHSCPKCKWRTFLSEPFMFLDEMTRVCTSCTPIIFTKENKQGKYALPIIR